MAMYPLSEQANRKVIMERATEWVVVSNWAPVAGSRASGGLCYEDYTDLRKAEDAFHDYERGEYPPRYRCLHLRFAAGCAHWEDHLMTKPFIFATTDNGLVKIICANGAMRLSVEIDDATARDLVKSIENACNRLPRIAEASDLGIAA